MAKRKDRVVGQLVRGIHNLLKASNIPVITGRGRLVGPNTIEVPLSDRTELITAEKIIVATGSSASVPPIPGAELPGVIDSNGALKLQTLPEHVIVAGAGAVGVEWATLFALLGGQVTLVEMLPRVVPNEDSDVSAAMRKVLTQQGVKIHTATRISAIAQQNSQLTVELIDDETTTSVTEIGRASCRERV